MRAIVPETNGHGILSVAASLHKSNLYTWRPLRSMMRSTQVPFTMIPEKEMVAATVNDSFLGVRSMCVNMDVQPLGKEACEFGAYTWGGIGNISRLSIDTTPLQRLSTSQKLNGLKPGTLSPAVGPASSLQSPLSISARSTTPPSTRPTPAAIKDVESFIMDTKVPRFDCCANAEDEQ